MRHNLQVRTGFDGIEDLVATSDTLFLTTSDGEIANVWDCIRHLSIQGKNHLSF